ncbi:MAG: DUF3576 domain-containing protein [Alphaproteobacteria bacterium]|nr:DUF3576 domain-containing protein [Alphaproteobacteria bacterium]
MTKYKNNILTCVAVLAALSTVSACSKVGKIEGEAKYPSGLDRNQTGGDIYGKKESIVGDGGLKLFGGKKEESGSVIGVNSFLWRATLDTISFMPLASADPFGGVVITDWYSDPETPNERVKVNAFITGRELKADGIKVSAFRQVNKGGSWKDAPVAEDTARKLEDSILTRARQLRVAHLADEN